MGFVQKTKIYQAFFFKLGGWVTWLNKNIYEEEYFLTYIIYIYIFMYLCDEITQSNHFSSFPTVGPKKNQLNFCCFSPQTMNSLNHPEEVNPD